MIPKKDVIAALRAKVAALTHVPSGNLDRELSKAFDVDVGSHCDITADLHCVLLFVAKTLPNWWVQSIGEIRTPIIYRGDKHLPKDGVVKWKAELQHINGGYMTTATHALPWRAVLLAAIDVAAIEAR